MAWGVSRIAESLIAFFGSGKPRDFSPIQGQLAVSLADANQQVSLPWPKLFTFFCQQKTRQEFGGFEIQERAQRRSTSATYAFCGD
jgi:hypothetical protein